MIRVFWYEFAARLESELARMDQPWGTWSLPRTATNAERIASRCVPLASSRRGLVAIAAAGAVVYEGLADACAQAGLSAVWVSPTQKCRLRAATAGIWDDSGDRTEPFRSLAAFVKRVQPAPVLALVSFPRQNDYDQSLAVGAADVLPRPCLIDDLLASLQRMTAIPHHAASQAPAA